MSDLRQIDPYSQQLGMLQAELRACGTNVEAMRQDHRVLDHKIEALRGELAELRALRALLVGDGDDEGLKQQVEKLALIAERGRVAWRITVWLAALTSSAIGLAYYLSNLLHWGHR